VRGCGGDAEMADVVVVVVVDDVTELVRSGEGDLEDDVDLNVNLWGSDVDAWREGEFEVERVVVELVLEDEVLL